MDAYEKFRLEFSLTLQSINDEDLKSMIMSNLDIIFQRYTIQSKEPGEVAVSDQINYIVGLYLSTRKLSGFSSNTTYVYKSILDEFFKMVNKSPSEVTSNDIRSYLYCCRNRTSGRKKISDRTAENYRNYICAFFKWAYNEGFIDKDPGVNIEKIRFVRDNKRALSRLEVENIRRICNDPREFAIVDTLLSTGCRISEALNIKISDIDWTNKSVRVLGKVKYTGQYFLMLRQKYQ